jgi:hypothetical protein
MAGLFLFFAQCWGSPGVGSASPSHSLCGVAGELPGATLGATGGAVPWEGKPLRGHV